MPSVIENKRIKEKCQIFTPAQTVSEMLDMAGYNENLFGKKVLENSCGNGEVLIQIVQRYINDCKKKRFSKTKIKIGLETDIVAYEIDDERINECINRLNIIAKEYKLEDVKWNINNLDFIITQTEDNYNYIIGNPPYIAYPDLPQSVQTYLKNNFTTCKKGKFDYSYAFIEKSYNCLSNGGVLVYIIPSNIFKNVFANNLRELIKNDLQTIVDFPDKQVFDKVLVSPAIITCLLLRIAPIASSGNICDASSKITISKLYVCASKKYDTDKGDIIKQGLIFKSRLGIVLNNFLIGIIRRFFPNSLVKILISS